MSGAKYAAAALLLLLGGAACGDASTPELCDEACRIWDSCEGPEGWYPYLTCVSECRDEGDWGGGYVDCLRDHQTCADLELHCG